MDVKHYVYLLTNKRMGVGVGGGWAGETYHHLVFLYVCAVVSESLVGPLLHMQFSLSSEPSAYDRVYRDVTDSVGLSGRCHSACWRRSTVTDTESEVRQSQLVTDSIRLILSVVTSVS